MQQGAQIFKDARSVLPTEVLHETFMSAANKLDRRDKVIVEYEIRTVAGNERLRGLGIMSAREVLARLGILFLDYPEAFNQLKKTRAKGE